MFPIKSDPLKTGDYIARLRKKREMTQLALATALKASHQAVSKWETGNALPDIDILLAMANLFEVSVDNLILGSDVHADPLENDRIQYSQTIAAIVKTRRDISLLFGSLRRNAGGGYSRLHANIGHF